MKFSLSITLVGILILTSAHAQNPAPDPAQEPVVDPVMDAIRKFNSNRSEKPNEVTVVLPPPGAESAPVPDDGKKEKESPENTAKTPVLVTGTPPDGSELVDPSKNPESPADEVPAVKKPSEGPNVRVENIKSGKGSIDPTKVKLLAPFPAKPLAPAPSGWRLQSTDQVPPFTREVELSPGKKITLSIRPHVLIPEADGTTVFNVVEPGFVASLGYQQLSTVGAILSSSTRQLDEDAKQMGVAIDQLQQLLGSLPKPEPVKPPAPAPKAISKTPVPRSR